PYRRLGVLSTTSSESPSRSRSRARRASSGSNSPRGPPNGTTTSTAGLDIAAQGYRQTRAGCRPPARTGLARPGLGHRVEALGHLRPVDGVPPGVDVVRAAVLVGEVI